MKSKLKSNRREEKREPGTGTTAMGKSKEMAGNLVQIRK